MPGAERKKGASGSPVKEVSQVREFFLRAGASRFWQAWYWCCWAWCCLPPLQAVRFLSSLMGFVTTPVQQISSQAAGAAGAVGPSGKTIEELEAENAELKEKLNQMIALTVDYYDIKRAKRAECQIPGAEGAEKGLPVRAGLCDRQRPGGSVLRLYHRSGLLVRN